MLESNAEKALQAKLIDITLDATKCNPGQSCSSRKFSVHAPFSGYESLMNFNAAEEFKSTCFMSVTFLDSCFSNVQSIQYIFLDVN
jgi:hypothetical protein